MTSPEKARTGCWACGYRRRAAEGHVCTHPTNQVIQFFKGTGPYLNERAMPHGCDRQQAKARRAPKVYPEHWMTLHDHPPEAAYPDSQDTPDDQALPDGSRRRKALRALSEPMSLFDDQKRGPT